MNLASRALVFGVLILGAAPLGAQALPDAAWVGSWLGELKAGAVTLRIVFTIASTDGALSATMDSPDQGAKGIPVSAVTVTADAIRLEVKVANAWYAGTLTTDGKSIDGTWNQGGAVFPVLLSRLPGAFTLERPQDPKPPFPYTAQDVTFPNQKAGVQLAGTLTIPAGKGRFPAVVLVTGSGPQNRDEAIMGHKPFAVIADFLSRNGIAVLRYDDRGVAGSKGSFAGSTTLDFADDAEAAFGYLAARPEVDPKRVGILGHSEGGLIAPIVAARNPAVGFIVLLAGPGVRGDQLILAQGDALARAAGTDAATADWSHALNAKLYQIIEQPGDPAANAAEAKDTLLAGIDSAPKLTDQERQTAKAQADNSIAQLSSAWFRLFLSLDPATYLSHVTVPVLALNGTLDLQVPPDLDLPAIQAALTTAGNKHYTLMKLDGLNHLFQHATTGLPDEYGKLTETFAPEALSAIRDWILAR